MSISTAILADAPQIYWKLDDATGPAASDSSGHGRAGAYGGQFQLQQPGPEAGTFAALFDGVGDVASVADTPVTNAPLTLEVWLAAISLTGIGAAAVYDGTGSANGTGLVFGAGPLGANQLFLLRGGVSNFATGFNIPDTLWHQLVLTRDATPNIQVFVDGSSVVPLQAGGGINVPGVGDKFHAGPGIIGSRFFVAHAALFSSVLSSTRIAAHFTARVSPQEPGASAGGVAASLDEILKFIRKTYQNTP